MKKYPEYNFFSSQPILYEMVKRRTPLLFNKIKERIQEGRWEVEGALWVEPDCNLPSGESFVRQILYGKKYFKENFDKTPTIAWLVDSFGYNAALPQIFKKSGIELFVTSKLNWNDTNTLPNDLFYWQGIDGTKIPAYILSAQDYVDGKFVRGSVYNAYVRPSMQKGTYKRFRDKNLIDEVLLTFGYGDGGGGPAAEQFEQLRRMRYGAFDCPKSTIGKACEFKDRLISNIKNTCDVPVWRGELYLEFHRGTYTSIAKIKKQNRKNEYLLQNAELFSSIAHKLTRVNYPSLEETWLKILTAQFHDILPGSAIKEVYDETDRLNTEINQYLRPIVDVALSSLVEKISCDDGIVVFNPSSFEVDDQISVNGKNYYVQNIPAKGYRFIENNQLSESENKVIVQDKHLENDFISVIFDDNYNISSIIDKKINRQILKEGQLGNRLAVYEDHPVVYDAWELDNYCNMSCEFVDKVISVKKLSCGYEIVRQYLQTVITQEITLSNYSSMITFKTKVDWKERHMLLKAVFPLNINTENAVCDIPFGNIERSTLNNTSWEQAQFEVSAHKYVDLCESDYGVALINDCKYGYGIKNNNLSLSLLRAPEYPYANADYGMHEFTYALYPHEKNTYLSDVYKRSLLFNNPLVPIQTKAHKGEFPREYSFVSCDCDRVVIDSIKQSEDKKGYVIRLFERTNSYTLATIKFGFNVEKAYLCNLLEDKEESICVKDNTLTLTVNPYEIITIYVE